MISFSIVYLGLPLICEKLFMSAFSRETHCKVRCLYLNSFISNSVIMSKPFEPL